MNRRSDPLSARPTADSFQIPGDSVLNDSETVSEQTQSESANGAGYDRQTHEEVLRELREEVRTQREQLSQLGSQPSGDQGARMEAVLLRISELERKVSEGASDPLLNEIVHRLASLELFDIACKVLLQRDPRSDPPDTYSMTRNCRPSHSSTASMRTMLGWFRLRRISPSRRKRSSSSRSALASSRTLSATWRPLRVSSAR